MLKRDESRSCGVRFAKFEILAESIGWIRPSFAACSVKVLFINTTS
jgi:hypothetical protein